MDKLTERHVQAIWYDAALRPKCMYTRRGSAVSVLSPGVWNLEAGPDFKDAVLEIGRERHRIVGDVEVHLCPNDWDIHKHGTDPRYRNVIAHVTWGCGPESSTLPSGSVSIWMGRFVKEDMLFSPRQIDITAYPYARLPLSIRPCEEKFAQEAGGLHKLLISAGVRRLKLKSQRLLGRLCEGARTGLDRRQIFYEETMVALGYKVNADVFRHVAERVPLEDLLANPTIAEAALKQAGKFEDWYRSGIRPINSPSRRLSAAAEMFSEKMVKDCLEVRNFTRCVCNRLISTLCGVERKVLGRGRAAAILANVVLPMALAEGRVDEVPEWLPAEDVSSPVRLMASRILGRDHNPRAWYAGNGVAIQGLLQIYHEWCRGCYPDCARCGIFVK